MYQFSRSLYRELAPEILARRVCPHGPGNHEQVLRACEEAVRRLATDRHYFARPSRTLFQDVRVFFPMVAQARVYRAIDRHLALAGDWFAAQPATGYDVEGNRLECRATTRRGTACRRTPLAHNGYCPSHQHLAEPDSLELAA